MRDLVARYLSQGISRRGFVGGLTKAGLTATAAQSVLTAVASVSSGHAQGAGPQAGSAAAAMAAGYIKASGEAAIVMQAAVVGMANAIGQMFNAFKEQTPLVVYSYRTDQSRRAGRDGFEEVANQEQMVQPITKYTWLARRPDMIPETVRRGFKAAWTPPYGPAYISWHSDYNHERGRTEIIAQELIDPRMT